MKRICFYAIAIALLLVMISGLTTGCEWLSSAPAPPASEYPADIIGRVTVAEFLTDLAEGSPGVLNPAENNIFWVVNISIKNKTYPQPVTSDYWKDWAIISGANVYKPPEIFKVLAKGTQIKRILTGQTGQILNCFEVPSSLTLSNAQIVYQGQQPYSYGILTGGDKVAGYNFLLKKAVTISSPTTNPKTSASPSGTYVGTLQGFEISLTFKGDVLEYYDKFNGKLVFKYTISQDGSTMTTTNVATGVTSTGSFKYIKEYDCVVIYTSSDTPIQCYKK